MRSLLFLLLTFVVLPGRAQQWQLVWEDNFDSLNTERWLVQNHFDHYGGELQVYTSRPENVFTEDGNLILRVLRENYTCPPESLHPWGCARQYNTGSSYQYTSGWVETQPAYNTQYGMIEARISLPYGRGFWPAFWTFVGEGLESHTNAAEIDIFEMYGHKPATNLETNVHLEYCNPDRFDYPACPSIPSYHKSHLIPSYANKFHVYAIEWTPEFLKWRFNGTAIRVMNNPGVVDPVRTIMNMAVLVGNPPTANTPFPSDIKVDYVRVYEDARVTSVQSIAQQDARLNLYPNPARHFVTVNMTDLKAGDIKEVELFDMTGGLIFSIQDPSDKLVDLPLIGLAQGMYLIKVTADIGITTTTFLKQ
jgi:beta-glucanase (GH16 family)